MRYLVIEPINFGLGVLKPGREIELDVAIAASEVAAGRLQPVDDAESDEERVAREQAQAEAAAAALLASASVEDPIPAQVALGDTLVDVAIVGQAEDGSPVIDGPGADQLEAAVETAPSAVEKKPARKTKGK